MSRFLMTTWDGGGNVPPLLHIGSALAARGHEVRVLGHEAQRGQFARAGLHFEAYRRARSWSRTAARDPLDVFEVFADPGAGEDVRDSLDAAPADVMIGDCLILGALHGAQSRGVTTAAVFHSFFCAFGFGIPQTPVVALGAPHGIDPQAIWSACDEVLVTADRELDDTGDDVAPNIRWTGVAQPAVAAPAPRDDPARLLLSLSTVWFDGQQEAMQRILDAIGQLPVSVVATIDCSVAADRLEVPANVELCGVVPHSEVMPGVSAVIGHGGHATTMLALAHGLPLLVVPQHEMADQVYIGQRLAADGAAIVVGQQAPVDELRRAIEELVANESYARAAAAIGVRLRAQDGAAVAADRLEALAGAPRSAAPA